MDAYEPLDLSAVCNAGLDVLGQNRRAPIGQQSFHGLPFVIGNADGSASKCFVGAGDGLGESTQIPIGKAARNVIVAHRLLSSEIMNNGQLGNHVADYQFTSGGETVTVPIRERFEIVAVPYPGGSPFTSFPDQKDGLQPRYEGPWGNAGRRQMEAVRGTSRGYVLWVWQNPNPDQVIDVLEITPLGPPFIIAAITLGYVDEFPISREALKEMIITLPREADAETPFDIDAQYLRQGGSGFIIISKGSFPMKHFVIRFFVFFAFATLAIGCQQQGSEVQPEQQLVTTEQQSVVTEQQSVATEQQSQKLVVEAACGQCQFGLPGKSCDLAVRIMVTPFASYQRLSSLPFDSENVKLPPQSDDT
jgi:hypothetical protein